MKTSIIALTLASAISINSFAQSDATPEKELSTRLAQVSFVPPLSTNGIYSTRYINNFSLNMLGGAAGGLNGAEFSGLFAIETDNVRGAQFAGIFNAVRGSFKGAQFGGIVNVAGKEVNGAQFGGIANITGKELDGAQFAGIANVATSVEGAQVAGIVNVAAGNVKGAQIGLINLANHVDGVQIGLINVAKDGYRRVELWGSDVLYGNVALKMGGNRKFYNIFAAGATLPETKNTRWGYGYGIGTNFFIGKKSQLSIEGMSYQIHEHRTSWNALNQLNQLRASFILPLKNNFALTVTPTFNVQVTQLRTNDGTIGTEWVSYNVYNKLFNNKTRVMMWPGLNVGIQF
ncbi:LA_2272 family surface repeat-containing protein [Telluribacter humicola]|uniref:LA_2272 family surface repeat-containing protein n=1 Tax=Telluribacter humicola TaxID=1720261 RepID=UPI001A95F18C|nr:hypothetical protein [Telluribacter humicola]